jgi:hypothetical protein
LRHFATKNITHEKVIHAKISFKNECGGHNAQGVVQVRWLQVSVWCAFVYFSTHLGAFWLFIDLFPCCGIGFSL